MCPSRVKWLIINRLIWMLVPDWPLGGLSFQPLAEVKVSPLLWSYTWSWWNDIQTLFYYLQTLQCTQVCVDREAVGHHSLERERVEREMHLSLHQQFHSNHTFLQWAATDAREEIWNISVWQVNWLILFNRPIITFSTSRSPHDLSWDYHSCTLSWHEQAFPISCAWKI